jgi:hypothetical protein
MGGRQVGGGGSTGGGRADGGDGTDGGRVLGTEQAGERWAKMS